MHDTTHGQFEGSKAVTNVYRITAQILLTGSNPISHCTAMNEQRYTKPITVLTNIVNLLILLLSVSLLVHFYRAACNADAV